MHASDQSDFGRLPFGFESFVEVFNDGIKTSGAQGRHEQSAPYRSSAPPDSATAFESTAVMWEGSDADQSGEAKNPPVLRPAPLYIQGDVSL